MGRLNIYAIMFMLSSLFGFANLQAQSYEVLYDADIPFNPNPIGASVTSVDRWGYPHTPKLPTYMGGGGMQTLSLSCGNGNQFTLVFEDELLNNGIGFNSQIAYSNPTTGFVGTLGEMRRQTACAVFTYISNVIDIGTAQPIIFFPVSQIPQVGVLGIGTSFYDYPASAGFWGGHLNQYITTGINPNPTTANYNEHAQITIDFDPLESPTGSGNYIYFNSDWTISSDLTGDIDLFSIILHEATHCLGFASFMSSNGNSGVANSLYTKYDQYLSHNSNFLLDVSGNYIGGIGATTSDEVFYENAANTLPYPVFSPIAYQNGSSLSHFDEDRYPNIMYVMRSSTAGGDDRQYTQPELEVLCNLGYTLLNATTCGINFLIGNPDANIGVGGIDVCTNVINNDTGNGFAMGIDPTSVTVLNGSGTVTYFNNSVICFTPNPNFCGTAYIQYRPKDMVNNIMGTFTTLTITVNCTSCPDDPCNYVCNGGFEDAASAVALDNFCANNNWVLTLKCPTVNLTGWCPSPTNFYSGNFYSPATPDLCVRGATYQYGGYPALGIPINRFLGPLSTPTAYSSGVETCNYPLANDHYIHMSRAQHSLPYAFDGIYRDLVQPILSPTSPIDYYFEMYCFSEETIGKMNVYLSENPPASSMPWGTNFSNGLPILLNEPCLNDGLWHKLSANITIPPNPGVTYRYIIIEPTQPTDGITDGSVLPHSILLDGIRLEKVGDQLQIEKEVSDATPQVGDIITYTLTITNNGTNTSNQTTVDDPLPSGLSYVGILPNFPVTIPPLTSGASTIITYQVKVTTLVELNTPITNCASVVNSACLSNSDCVDIIVKTADIAIQKRLNTDNPIYGSNVDFTITISNNGPNDAHNVQVLETLQNSPCLSGINPVIAISDPLATYNMNNGILTIPTLAVGQVVTLDISTLFSGNVLCEAICQNCAELLGLDESDLNTSNDLACVQVINTQTPPTIDWLIGSNTNIPDATTLIGLMGGAITLSQQNIQIDGVFKLDLAMFWDDCEVVCNTGAKIEITSKLYLQNNTHLYACQDMWWGIELIDVSASANPGSSSGISVTNSIIEDAQWAVWANNNTAIYVDGSTFQQNFVSIYTPQSQSYNVIGGSISNSVFDGYTPLQNNNLFAAQLPLPPLNRALAGIWIHNVAYPIKDNTFRGLCNGIIANRAVLSVDRCIFKDIQAYSNYGADYEVEKEVFTPTGTVLNNSIQNFNGTGIISRGSRGFFSLRQTGLGNASSDPLSFENCKRGIVSIYCNLYSGRNNMQIGEEAYFVYMPSYMNTGISFNRMNCGTAGVNVVLADFNNNTTIMSNDITVHNPILPGNDGIFLNNFFMAPNTTIAHNTLNINKGRNGIAVNNGYKALVMRNKVNLLSSTARNGIILTNSSYANVLCNEVGGFSNSYATAIRFYESTNNLISCNTTYQTAYGFYFQGNCTTDEQFRGNTMGTHGTGLRIGDGAFAAKIGVQTHRGNRWTGSYGNVGAVCAAPSVPTGSSFKVHDLVLPWNPPSSWFVYQANNVPFDSCGNVGVADGLCLLIPTDNPHKRTASDYQVASGLDTDFLFGEEYRYNAEKELFSKLLQDSLALPDSGIFRAFYDSKTGTSIESFSQINQEHNTLLHDSLANQLALIDSLISDKMKEISLQDSLTRTLTDSADIVNAEVTHQTLLDDLNDLLQESRDLASEIANLQNMQATAISSENANISQNLLVEQNEKAINAIFYNTIAKNNLLFTEQQAQNIRDIAFQCPLSGGKGVFKARALYTFIYGDTIYNDSVTCAAQGLMWRKGNPQNTNVKVIPTFSMIAYPNPASDEVTFEFSEEIKTSGQFIIYNSIGEKVTIYTIPEGARNYTIPVRNFAQGGYYAQLQVGGIQTATKLIIQH